MTPELIESSAQMDELITRLNDEKLIAVDTEFFRETTYYPQLALVQIATGSVVACIDPLAFDAKPALQKILLDDRITKIFHSCSQDLEVLFYYLGETPAKIYDTQIANALLSEHHQIGYAKLVENELAVQLDKSQTRTNWLQRPLTKKQIQYAGDDVFYLYKLQHKLDEKLQLIGRKAWFDEECVRLISDGNSFQLNTKHLWRRVKGATRLSNKALALVQAIALWREQLAQHKDKTRRRVLADDTVIQLALDPPETADALGLLIERRFRINNEATQQLFNVIETALQSGKDEWPDNRFNILDNRQKLLLKNLQQLVNNKAEELGLSSAILCSKKDIEKLILSHDKAPESQNLMLNNSQNWRYQCIGQQLQETIKNTK